MWRCHWSSIRGYHPPPPWLLNRIVDIIIIRQWSIAWRLPVTSCLITAFHLLSATRFELLPLHIPWWPMTRSLYHTCATTAVTLVWHGRSSLQPSDFASHWRSLSHQIKATVSGVIPDRDPRFHTCQEVIAASWFSLAATIMTRLIPGLGVVPKLSIVQTTSRLYVMGNRTFVFVISGH